MQRQHLVLCSFILGLALVSGAVVGAGGNDASGARDRERIARGEYLVTFGSCHDCHTPFKPGPKGPEPDMTRALSGHPADVVMPPPPALDAAWVFAGSGTNTAWTGPWGVSFTANLTSDKETGIGNWTEEMFVVALRTGRHEGRGRPILPPMPWRFVGSLSDEDLRAVFAYLQSTPPIRNKVPSPIDPAEE
jgi:hypothetical protein